MTLSIKGFMALSLVPLGASIMMGLFLSNIPSLPSREAQCYRCHDTKVVTHGIYYQAQVACYYDTFNAIYSGNGCSLSKPCVTRAANRVIIYYPWAAIPGLVDVVREEAQIYATELQNVTFGGVVACGIDYMNGVGYTQEWDTIGTWWGAMCSMVVLIVTGAILIYDWWRSVE